MDRQNKIKNQIIKIRKEKSIIMKETYMELLDRRQRETIEKYETAEILLECFYNEQLDEVIEILKSIISLTENLECVTPEKRTSVYNEVIKAIESIEKIEIEKQKEKHK